MYEFIKLQYAMGNITAEQVRDFVPRWITEEEAEKIVDVEPEEAREP